MYKTHSCEFHQANDLDLFYTDETFKYQEIQATTNKSDKGIMHYF